MKYFLNLYKHNILLEYFVKCPNPCVKKAYASYLISRGDIGMSRSFKNFNNLKDVLKGLIEQQVTIILVSGQKLTVEVDAVVDNLLVASVGNRLVFIDIECICVVITCCEKILEFVLNNMRGHEKNHEKECSREHEDMLFDGESKDCGF